jgi:histidine ammonia-lyase
MPAAQGLREAGIEPIRLEAKEGLALLNGTQAMGAVGALALLEAEVLLDCADVASALSLEALLGTPVAFDARIHAGRGKPGQIERAARVRALLAGSEIRDSHIDGDPRVQDAYSLRCAPQVHGAVADALGFARVVVERETAAATDNPLVFADTSEVLSGGNFHGAPLAHAFDFARLALVDLLAIVERRIDRLVNPDLNEGLPPFLCREPGVSSGFMIPHVTAVALLAEARSLAHPVSIDSVPTSGGKEDHVSMGMTAALLLRRVVEIGRLVVATELLAAAEGIEHRRPLRSGPRLEAVHHAIRRVAPPLIEDRPLGSDVEALAASLDEIRLAAFESSS